MGTYFLGNKCICGSVWDVIFSAINVFVKCMGSYFPGNKCICEVYGNLFSPQ